MGGTGLQGGWRVQLHQVPEGLLFLSLPRGPGQQHQGCRGGGSLYTLTQGSSAGLGPAALSATWELSHCHPVPYWGLTPCSCIQGTLQCCLCPTPSSPRAGMGQCGGQPHAQKWFWGIVAGELGALCPETKPDPGQSTVLGPCLPPRPAPCSSPHNAAGPSTGVQAECVCPAPKENKCTPTQAGSRIFLLMHSCGPRRQPGPA